jgi:alpha-amylase
MAVLMSDGPGGSKRMFVDRQRVTFADLTGNIIDLITSGDDGYCDFRCNGASVSLWVEQ